MSPGATATGVGGIPSRDRRAPAAGAPVYAPSGDSEVARSFHTEAEERPVSDQNVGPQPAPGPGSKQINSKATWSLVGGILSVTVCGIIVGIAAIIVGRQAQAEIAASGGLQGGEARARWGIVLGGISVAISVLVAIIVAITYAGG